MAGKLIEYPFDTVKVRFLLGWGLTEGPTSNAAGYKAIPIQRPIRLFPSNIPT